MTTLGRVQDVPHVREVPSPYEQIAEHYRARIRAQKLKPGQRMPSVAEIAKDWHVATSTAGRVIAALRQGGWVTTVHGRATYVAEHPPP